MATLNSHERDALKDSDFALSGRRYPIHDEAHARDALARIAANGSPEDIAEVRKKVHARYPSLAGDGDEKKPLAAEAGAIDGVVVWNRSGDYFPALTLASNIPKDRNGIPCHAYWKEALKPAVIDDVNGKTWNITPSDIDDAVGDANRALALGHEPLIQDHHYKPTKSYGFIKGARKNAHGGMDLLHVFMGDAERDEALRRKTSVMLLPNYKDEKGNQYKWWPDHSAIVFRPQFHGLDDFTPALAASNGQPVNAVLLALADEATPQGEPLMDLSTLRGALGETAKDKPDTDVLALAATAITAANDSRTKLRATLGTAAEGKPDGDLIALCADQIEANGVLASELTAAEQKVAEATEKLALSSEQVEPEMDARLKAMLSDAADQARELALSAGLTPAAAKLFDELFDDAKGKPNALALSACGASNRTTEYEMWRRIKQLVEQVDTAILKPNAPVRRNGVVGQPVEKLALGAEADTEEKPPTEERVGELLGSIGRAPVAAAK